MTPRRTFGHVVDDAWRIISDVRRLRRTQMLTAGIHPDDIDAVDEADESVLTREVVEQGIAQLASRLHLRTK